MTEREFRKYELDQPHKSQVLDLGTFALGVFLFGIIVSFVFPPLGFGILFLLFLGGFIIVYTVITESLKDSFGKNGQRNRTVARNHERREAQRQTKRDQEEREEWLVMGGTREDWLLTSRTYQDWTALGGTPKEWLAMGGSRLSAALATPAPAALPAWTSRGFKVCLLLECLAAIIVFASIAAGIL